MALKVGKRVTITASDDPQAKTRDGTPIANLVGRQGGIVEVDEESGEVLVDDQYTNGPTPQGESRMREWIHEDHLELG